MSILRENLKFIYLLLTGGDRGVVVAAVVVDLVELVAAVAIEDVVVAVDRVAVSFVFEFE